MRRIGIAAAVAALIGVASGCGGQETTVDKPKSPQTDDVVVGGSAACVDGVMKDGRMYVATGREKSSEAQGPQVRGVVRPGCNDTGGTAEPDVPVTAYTLEERPVAEALLVETNGDLRLYEYWPPSD